MSRVLVCLLALTTACTSSGGDDDDDDDDDDTGEGGPTDCVPPPTWYRDADGDGLGAADESTAACTQPEGWVADASDCDDGDPAVGAASEWFHDDDGDGHGSGESLGTSCDAPSTTAAAAGGDCDDDDPRVSPDAPEVCNGRDDDCDALVDDDDDDLDTRAASTFYADTDGDGWGDEGTTVVACVPPDDAALEAGDCDDTDPSVNPGRTEVCDNGVDDDCDGTGSGCGISDGVLAEATASIVFEGTGNRDIAGAAVSIPGDLDGDGIADLAIGAPDYYGTAGSSYVVLGPIARGGAVSSAEFSTGWEWGDGSSFATWGDPDGDGDVELAIGMPDDSRVYTVFGGALDHDETAWLEAEDGDNCGYAIAGGADLTGDGAVDVAVGCSGYEWDDVGLVYVAGGPYDTNQYLPSDAAATLLLEGFQSNLGASLATVGDLDGDGAADLLVGAPGDDTAYLVLGPVSGELDITTVGTAMTESSSYGTLVSALGDVTGDGYVDLLVGSGSGITYVYAGSASADLATRFSVREDVTAAAPAGDVDGDGADDLLLGDGEYDYGDGAVYVVSGPITSTVTAADGVTIVGADANHLGAAVAAGDVDGDGRADLAIGAPYSDARENDAGAVFVVLGGGI